MRGVQKVVLAAAFLLDGLAGRVHADAIPRVCYDYASALARCQAKRGAVPVESVYVMGLRASDALTLPARGGQSSLLENLSDSTLARLTPMMRGFTIVTEPGTGVIPNPHFFLKLARDRGDAADTLFFTCLERSEGPGGFVTWCERITDESGVPRFGDGVMTTCWGAWERFRRRFPGRYAETVVQEQDPIEQTLLTDGSSCGGRDTVVRELRLFLARYPRARIAKDVRDRLQEVIHGLDRMRYGECQ